ncbi:MAG: hypothetical protein FWB77_00195 [Treponema sp.]|nr:hypothetical protein [Treponema sp.]
MLNKNFLFAFIFLFFSVQLFSQDFGFGSFDDEENISGSNSGLSVSISGEVSASMMGYLKDFSEGASKTELGDIFSGSLAFSAGAPIAEAYIGVSIEPTETPIMLDEAYVRAYLGNFEIEGGFRKLTWGKADSFGPLDVINPLDYSSLTDLSDLMNFKIARPLVRLSYRFGSFSKIEGVFVPSFEPMRFAESGSRWYPKQMAQLDNLKDDILTGYQAANVPITEDDINILINKPDNDRLAKIDYAQAGLRFTTTIGSADLGFQYYYGRLTRPAVNIGFSQFEIPLPPPYPSMYVPVPSSINYSYNPYHQIGIDWAQVLFGFNIRAEFAANITEDLSGEDAAIYNPHLAWSFGFDRNLFWGINFSVQCNETIRLLNDKVSTNPYDIEADTDMTSTQIIFVLTKSLFRDQLELRAAVFWQVEAGDCMIVPSIVWTKDALSIELSGGFFAGDKNGQFGQYNNNNFIKTAVTYSF